MRVVAAYAAALLVTQGCQAESTPCASDDECYSNEVCVRGLCAPRGLAAAGDDGIAGTDDVASSPDDGGYSQPDTRPGSADLGTDTNGGGVVTDDAGVDAGAPAEDAGNPVTGCIADPFDGCPDPNEPLSGNDNFGEYLRTVGCGGAVFRDESSTVEGRMCPLDAQDVYYTIVGHCEDRPVVLEATFTVEQGCDPALFVFDSPTHPCIGGDPAAQSCETLPDGSQRIVVEIPPRNNGSTSVRWRVETPNREDVRFDYTLDIRVVP